MAENKEVLRKGERKAEKKKEKLSPRYTGINLKELEWQKLGQTEQQNKNTVFYYNQKYKINIHEFI